MSNIFILSLYNNNYMMPASANSSMMSSILSDTSLPAVIPGLSSPVSTSSWDSLTRPGNTVTATPTAGMMASWT